MRIRTVFAVSLLIPSVISAQGRRPVVGGRLPGVQGTMEGERQPEPIARAQAIVRSRVSLETYPMFSHVNAPGFSGGKPISSWNSIGQGTHIDFRHTEWLSSTLDMTAAYAGGPSTTQTIEAGFRVKQQGWEYRMRPFADVRFGWQHAADQYMSSASSYGIGPASPLASDFRYARGFGGIAGVGTDIALTNSFSLMTELSAMRANMTAYTYQLTTVPQVGDSYRMTTYRLSLGLRYNQARTVDLRQPVASQSLH